MEVNRGHLSVVGEHGASAAGSARDRGRHSVDFENRAPWRDLPEAFGPWKTVWDLFDAWNADGTLDEMLDRLRAARIDAGEVDDELWCIDGTSVLAARCAAGVKKGDPEEPTDHALGRSLGGQFDATGATKIHLLCDSQDHPLHFELSPGQAHETTSLIALLNGADEFVTDGDGDPVAWPAALAGDKGYRADGIDKTLVELDITPVIPSKANEDREARLVEFDPDAYRQRNIVERLIGWLKECRCVFARFEKTAVNFAGMIKMACIQRYPKLLTT